MFDLKPLSAHAIPAALAKAERYRLLNDAGAAESICLDILTVDPDHQAALVMLLLALTDQFQSAGTGLVERARDAVSRLQDDYLRAYYAGIVCERYARALLERGGPGLGGAVYATFLEAMSWYEKAADVRAPDNDDALLRWNTCARILNRHPQLKPIEDVYEPLLLE